MTETIITSIIAYLSTNIDDILILMLLFAGPNVNFQKVLFGKFIGVGSLTTISLLGAFGLGFIPQEYIRFLGVIPILLGIKAFFSDRTEEDSKPKRSVSDSALWSTAFITVANGADNIGVYIPLFAGYSLSQMLMTVIIFAAMTMLCCVLGSRIASLPPVRRAIQKYRSAVPVIYILLGIYILFF